MTALVACESSAGAFGNEHNGGLVLSEQLITLREGESARLAILERVDGTPLGSEVVWSSGNPWIAPVDAEGMVYASKPGVTTVYASDGDVEGSTRIKVQKSPKTLYVEPEEVRLAGPGAGYQLSAFTENGGGKLSDAPRAKWKSLDPDVIGVDGDGVVRGMGAGVGRVVAEQRGAADTAEIAVGTQVQVARVSVTPASATLTTGDSIQLSAAAYDGNGDKVVGLAFSWSSSDAAVASVAGKGYVNTWAEGTTQISAVPLDPSDGQPMAGVTPGTTTLTVKNPVRTISVAPDPAFISEPGAAVQLTATVLDANGSRVEGVSIEWLSLNPEVVDVNATGRAVGVAVGVTAITAAIAFGSTDTVKVEVQAPAGGSDGQAWITYDFDRFDSTEQLRAASDAYEVLHAESQYLELSNPPPGHTRSVRMEWPADPTGCYDTSRGRGIKFPEIVYEAWAEVQIRYDSYFTTHNPNCGANDHKVLFLQTNDGNRRWEIKAGKGGPDSPFKNYEVGVAGENVELVGIDKQFGNVNVDLWDGQWHTIRWHVRAPSTATAPDGRFTFWVDGVRKSDFAYASRNLVDPGARIPIRGLLLGRNKNDGPANTAMSMYLGSAQVWRNDPGW